MAKPDPVDWVALCDPPFAVTNKEISAPWTEVCSNLSGLTHVKILAEGSWLPVARKSPSLGPNGGPAPSTPVTLPELGHAPFGALVGKIGGASAGCMIMTATAPAIGSSPPAPWPPQLDQPFLIGVQAIFPIATTSVGPLYIGFNAMSHPFNVLSLKVEVYGAVLSP